MVRRQWRLRVRGTQRQHVNIELLVAAVLAFGEQLAAEQRQREEAAAEGSRTALCWSGREEGQ